MSWTSVGPDIQCVGRKPHQCDVCRGTIPVGVRHWQRTGVQQGEGFYTMHMHDPCYEEQKSWGPGDWEE